MEVVFGEFAEEVAGGWGGEIDEEVGGVVVVAGADADGVDGGGGDDDFVGADDFPAQGEGVAGEVGGGPSRGGVAAEEEHEEAGDGEGDTDQDREGIAGSECDDEEDGVEQQPGGGEAIEEKLGPGGEVEEEGVFGGKAFDGGGAEGGIDGASEG